MMARFISVDTANNLTTSRAPEARFSFAAKHLRIAGGTDSYKLQLLYRVHIVSIDTQNISMSPNFAVPFFDPC